MKVKDLVELAYKEWLWMVVIYTDKYETLVDTGTWETILEKHYDLKVASFAWDEDELWIEVDTII